MPQCRTGEGCMQHRTHTVLLIWIRTLLLGAVSGSSHPKPTGPTDVETLVYFSRLLSLGWHAVKWQLGTAECWVAATHPLCSCLAVHLWTRTVAYCMSCFIISFLWLPLLWMNIHTQLLSEIFWLDTLLQISPLMKVCGKVCRHPQTTLIHTEWGM